jgi:hypothetical protein
MSTKENIFGVVHCSMHSVDGATFDSTLCLHRRRVGSTFTQLIMSHEPGESAHKTFDPR